ncbi:MAG TPA: VanZ family protein [Polyangiaceae bacterium]|nr:VanZ family protein [Polyangiaceae bacterium]
MNARSRRLGWAWHVWPALFDAVAILVVGSLRTAPPGAERFSDKTLHGIAFGIFAWLAARAIRFLRPTWSASRVLIGGFLVSSALGGALEIWQGLLPYRDSELLDFVADALGAGAVMLLTGAVWQLLRSRAPAP